jgi:hypothetical protein
MERRLGQPQRPMLDCLRWSQCSIQASAQTGQDLNMSGARRRPQRGLGFNVDLKFWLQLLLLLFLIFVFFAVVVPNPKETARTQPSFERPPTAVPEYLQPDFTWVYPRSEPQKRKCWFCDGRGSTKCIFCDGRGFLGCNICRGRGCPSCDYTGIKSCSTCDGTGREPCDWCDGTGYR